jgi:hypothetical protein
MTPLEVAQLDTAKLPVTIEDILWLLLREAIIEKNDLHELACKFAEQLLPIFEMKYPDDKRPREAIAAKRAWLRGEIDDNRLRLVGDSVRGIYNVFWNAADSATAAYWVANRVADSATAAKAADSAVRKQQLQFVIEVLEG